MAAQRLAAAGVRDALLEQAIFPRDKPCGDGITAKGLAILARMGLGEWASRFPAPEMGRMTSPDGQVLDFVFSTLYYVLRLNPCLEDYSMREISVAAVQMQPELGRMEDNLIKMSEFIARVATEQPVDLIVFPELVTTGYEVGPRFPQSAQRIPGPTINLIAQRASEFGVHIAFGMVSKEKVESILYDTAILVGPDGDLIGQHHKMHLRGEERIAFRAGYRLNSFETAFGTVGMMIGWDLAFPEVARSLALEGAELLVVCASWEQPHAEEWRVYLLARAYENAVFVAAANRVGEEPSYTFFGQSGIVGPQGKIYATVEQPTEGYAIARIDLEEVRRCREETQILQYRQPAAYRAIVKRY